VGDRPTKKTRPAVLVGFKSILFGRLEETG